MPVTPAQAVELIRGVAGESLGPVRCPGPTASITPAAIRQQLITGDIGMRPAALGDMLAWAVADPGPAADLSTLLGGAKFEPVEQPAQPTSEKVLVLRDGNAVLWESVRGVSARKHVVDINTEANAEVYYQLFATPEEAETYRDELIERWTRVLA